MTSRQFIRLGFVLGAVICGAIMAAAAITTTFAQAAASHPSDAMTDISGLWLVHDPGSGDWSSFFENVPKASIVPEIQKMNEEENARVSAGYVVSAAHGPNCPFGNLPMMMASSPPLDIVQSKDEVLIGSESNRDRVVYTDGRGHVNPTTPGYAPSGVGDSIGHWDGDTLVVDTTGFAAKTCDTRWPVMRVPGGGRAKDTTHLTERYKLINGGKQLSVTFTWEDPTIYRKPHSYSYTYDLIENGLPFENGNDVTDSELEKQVPRESQY